MHDKLGLFFGSVLLVGGAALLYLSVARTDTSQSVEVVGGAILFSLGAMLLGMVFKNWWGWRKYGERHG
jgi:hypothetical protein